MIKKIFFSFEHWVESNTSKANIIFFAITTILTIISWPISTIFIVLGIFSLVLLLIFILKYLKSLSQETHLQLLKILITLLILFVVLVFAFPRMINVTINNNYCGPETAEKFTASLIPTLSGSTINAKFYIKNKTTEPLFLAADDHLPATLLADKYIANTTALGRPSGISSYAISLGGVNTEQAYTRIAPGQTHKIGLVFETKLDSKISGETDVTVTMNFLNLDNGNVKKVAASPCAVMKVGN